MPTDDRAHPSEYLSLTELCERIRYAPKSVYNMISQGVFKERIHYFKPTPRKLLFFWPAIEQWIRGEPHDRETEA
jgi:predicted DNA-binding transcriptional regulator AlpA